MKRYALVDLAAMQDELGDELEAAVLGVVRASSSSAAQRSRSSSARSPTTRARPR